MTLDLSLLPDGGMPWIAASGPHADIVLSSRVRLARNVAGFPFSPRAGDADRLRVLHQVREAAAQSTLLAQALVVRVDELSANERRLLHERHLVSRELAELDAPVARCGAAVLVGDEAALMVNEEDHLRLQVFRSGFDIAGAWERAGRLERELGDRLPLAYHREFGFLTSCPTNVGTGLRASVLVHLPGLVLTQEIGKVLTGLQQMGLTYRGLYGEGSEVVGNFFQISNQTTLGRTEDELCDHLTRVVAHVIARETEARRVLSRDAGYIIEDKLWRAYGTLRYARSLGADEAMNLLSGVRLAVGLFLVRGLSVYTLNKLLVFSQTAHLSLAEGRPLTESDANLARARYVRGVLAAEGDGA
ncbi:MAG: protein arginine kinase [Gemmatimonadaceae bacterium]|nr:protein arginine kinase [Gemmatimonadaceae bacterium]